MELFSDIKPGGHGRWTQENLHPDRHIWEPSKCYYIAANEDRSILTISFPLPCMESFYLSKPDEYCGHLVGFGTYPFTLFPNVQKAALTVVKIVYSQDVSVLNGVAEGEGSLLSVLKCKGLGRAVVAGCGEGGLEANSMIYVFCIGITLTAEGVKQVRPTFKSLLVSLQF